MKKELLHHLETTSLNDIKKIINQLGINIFDVLKIEELVKLQNDKFSYFYKQANPTSTKLIELTKHVLNKGTVENVILVLSNKDLITYQHRTKASFIQQINCQNQKIIKAYLNSELIVTEEHIVELIKKLIHLGEVQSFEMILKNSKYNLIANEECWSSLYNGKIDFLKIFTEDKNFKYINNKLIAKCFMENKYEHVEYLLNIKEKNLDFIKFVAERRNKLMSRKHSQIIFKFLLEVPSFISKIGKKELKLFQFEDDIKLLELANKANKIKCF